MESTMSLPPVISSSDLLEQVPGSDTLFRVSSFPSGSLDQQCRRRRTSSLLSRQRSFGREVGHAAAETYLVTRLSFKLLRYLGVGYRWISRLLALFLYAMFLMPGFLQVAFCYFFSSQVHRSIVYGDRPRNRLDLYLPKHCDDRPKPVVIFVTGGAWIIGYKAWGSLLGLQLAQRDIIVASIDYRNFPQGTISDMIDDISEGISYVCNNVVEFGGNPNKIYLMGQSAGAHISSCALLQQAVKESSGEEILWSVSQIRAYFGLSGGIMEGEQSLKHFSPEIIAQSPSLQNAIRLLPHFILFHVIFGLDSKANPKIQDPLRGGKDELFDYILTFIHADDKEALANDAMAPPRRRFVYLVAENRVLKIHPFRNGTTESAVELFFGPVESDIIGIAVSISSSCVVINVKDRGLFALRLHGKLLWSAGPVLYRHGYRQGCSKCTTDCYFTSVPVIDHCEASIYVSNTVGELYSLSVSGPHFKWIQDFSSYGNKFTIAAGNNGLLYVIIPHTAQILALEISMGSIVWEGSVGPLSSEDYEPVVDANGWISIGSLDGFLYSFSPTGSLRKFPQSTTANSFIQVNPVLDCSGYAVYVSQTEMEEREANIIGDNTYVAAMKPRTAVFTLLVPALGSSYWSESNHSDLLFDLSQSDMKHFAIDERTLLSFFAASRNGNPFPCLTTRNVLLSTDIYLAVVIAYNIGLYFLAAVVSGQKLESSCSLIKPKKISIYTGNESTIVLFLFSESVLLVFLAASIKYCCTFWKKKRLQSLSLGPFLEKRHSLRLQQKKFDRAITELERKASEEAVTNEVLEKLNDLVKEREGIKRKLSTTYSLGRDGEKSGSKTVLPLYDGTSRSHSFQGPKNESVTIFHTPTDSVSSSDSSLDDTNIRNMAKGKVEVGSSSDDEIQGGFVNPLLSEHSEIEGVRIEGDDMEKGNIVGKGFEFHLRMAVPVVRFPIFPLVRLIGITLAALTLIWTERFRGGMALVSEDKALIFNVHPVLMLIGFLLTERIRFEFPSFDSVAMIAYKAFSGTKDFKKLVHLVLLFLALCFGVIGVWAAWKFHNEKGVDNFYSLHSWLGLACLFFFGIQWAAGFVTFWYPGGTKSSRANLLPWHALFGIYIYVLAVATCATGFLEKATFLQVHNIISRYSTEALLINSLGILTVVLAGLLILAVVSPSKEKFEKGEVLKV
ncbi:protein GAMETE EXPRESSED 3 [Dorcoceras hygrometricum]|uniref:Protein GAMETE EXPRESSED 3 n=1 Tax=Dorcoceras hygrometricum TaxID=472368 RepID=A0A2Z7A0T4_9LAMI|nr:protein GAMETE EXPRESSED 3 [Dorcoceras hygrometricum]